jgi:peptide/nickel transport system ATP-binding protein/oligopeptide transport system ATP-binding protein
MDSLLEVKNLSVQFNTQDGVVKAVNRVSFNIASGETVAIVGESGCGKTVSVLSLLRLIKDPPGRIMEGEIYFNKTDLLRLSMKEMRDIRGARISMIFQEPLTSLNPVLTIGLQLTEALEAHRNMSHRDAQQEAIRLLNSVGISNAEHKIREYPHRLSGGMRQRVMIAMAISCHPQLIIADEPTTALDVTVQAQLLELIRNITLTMQTSLILITHNLGIVARYAQRVYVMYAGMVIEHGSAKDIFHSPAHPYTMGLLASVPRFDKSKKNKLVAISGQPPDLINSPRTCAFKPRCTYSQEDCGEESPVLSEISQGHFTSCILNKNGNLACKKI